MIKEEIDNGAIYEMKIFRNGKCTWESEFRITGGHIDKQQRDQIARVSLIKKYYEDLAAAPVDELLELIPIFNKENK